MMKWMRKRLGRDEGFTLIELMVVVLIIAILIAIAIPSFLGFRRNAQDRSAQSDVRNMLLAEQAYYTEWEAYTETESDLQTIEPSILENDDSTLATDAELSADGTAVCVERTSDSGNVFAVYIGEADGVHYAKVAAPATCPNDGAGIPSGFTADGWG